MPFNLAAADKCRLLQALEVVVAAQEAASLLVPQGDYTAALDVLADLQVCPLPSIIPSDAAVISAQPTCADFHGRAACPAAKMPPSSLCSGHKLCLDAAGNYPVVCSTSELAHSCSVCLQAALDAGLLDGLDAFQQLPAQLDMLHQVHTTATSIEH